MFHDTLLGAHYGPVNTYYTIKDCYWIHNMIEKLQRYISSCDACQQQKQKRGKILYYHLRIPLSYNPMSTSLLISNICLKVFMTMNFC